MPTRPVRVTLLLAGSTCDEDEVVLYLAGDAETHTGAETLEEFLNHPRRFVPARSVPAGRNHIVRREAIVMVSAVYRGWRFAHDVKQTYGADDYIEKPFSIDGCAF